jgi:hypothetical protein
VVYVEDAARPISETIELTIRDGAAGPRLEPEHAVFHAGGRVVLNNRSRQARLISCPSQQILQQVAAGESIVVALPEPGAHDFHLLDARDASAQVFASPGAYARVARSGRYVLPDLPPGSTRIGVWHPRFTPRRARVELAAGDVVQLEFELGPGATQEARLASP